MRRLLYSLSLLVLLGGTALAQTTKCNPIRMLDDTADCDWNTTRYFYSTYDLFVNPTGNDTIEAPSGTTLVNDPTIFFGSLQDYTNVPLDSQGKPISPDDFTRPVPTNGDPASIFEQAIRQYEDGQAGEAGRGSSELTAPITATADPSDGIGGGNVSITGPRELLKTTINQSAPGQFLFRQLMKRILDFFQRILIPLGVLLLTIGGVQTILLQDSSDEQVTKRRNQILTIGGGFLLLNFAFRLVETLVFGRQGELFRENFEGQVTNPITFAGNFLKELTGTWYINPATNKLTVDYGGMLAYAESFVVPIAVLMIVIACYQLLFSQNSEATLQAGKKVGMTLAGIFLFYVLRYGVNFLTTRPELQIGSNNEVTAIRSTRTGEWIQLTGGQQEIPDIARRLVSPTLYESEILSYTTQWVNYVVGFLGILGVAMVIVGGVRMILGYLDPDQHSAGRATVVSALIGLVLAFSAFVIIRYFTNPFNVVV